LLHYDEGRRLCPRGHFPIKRVTLNGCCVACQAEWAAQERASHPERQAGRKATYTERHPDRVLQQARETYARRCDDPQTLRRLRALHREWKQANKVACCAHEAKRRAGNNNGHFATQDIAELMTAQHGKCAYFAYCRASLAAGFHIDHVMPLHLGGANDRTNLQLTCQSCNMRKGRRHPAEFARWLAAQ